MWVTAGSDSIQVYDCIYSESLSGGLICEPFLHADFLAVCPVHAVLAGLLFLQAFIWVLQPLICLHVYFIDCKCKIDFRHVYGLARYIPVRAVTLYFDF